jgi:uncharacterized membrane protein
MEAYIESMAEISFTDGSTTDIGVAVRRIGFDDVTDALRRGVSDFEARPTSKFFVTLIYPVLGLLMVWIAMQRALVPLIFPLVSGFALLGPFFAIGLYEISRGHEHGEVVGLGCAFNIMRYPSKGALLLLGTVLAALFFAWLVAAMLIYTLTIGQENPASLADFAHTLFATQAGWTLIILGNAVGFIFALAVLAISVVSFPLILDRHVSAGTAIATSVDAIVRNPGPMLGWGLIVGIALFVGSLPAFIGLAVVFPILGHATWHLYRKIVA